MGLEVPVHSRAQRSLMVAIISVAFASGGCGFDVPSAQPSESYPHAMALAQALDEHGVACENPELTHDRPKWEQVACGGTANKAYEYLLVVFADAEERTRWFDRESMGCDGPVVYGENWHVVPADNDALTEIVEAVGGEVVGTEVSDRCPED